MPDQYSNEPMLDMYMFETAQLIEQLEQSILSSEKSSDYTPSSINEIFRIMHTIKGSSAMMLFNNISILAHAMEDLFYFIREEKSLDIDNTVISDMVLEGIDFIKIELEKIKNGDNADGDPSSLIHNIRGFLDLIKQSHPPENAEEAKKQNNVKQQYYISQGKTAVPSYKNSYKAVITFEEGCEMENIRAYTVLHSLKDITQECSCIPEDIIDNDDTIQLIRENGFTVFLKANLTYNEMYRFFMQTVFLKELELVQLDEKCDFDVKAKQEKVLLENQYTNTRNTGERSAKTSADMQSSSSQSIISVNVHKLDKLMDLVGEMVIAESMVIENPDLAGMELDNFQKAARQLRKITGELQDTVMAIRMVPLSATFYKMHRIVRDMSRKLDKQVNLDIIGEETEVDKNIMEHISDPLMHLVRNSIDHGIEDSTERIAKGKPQAGTITLEARNSGSDVLIIIKDDGKGLNKEKILKKARESGVLYKPEADMTDKEIFNLIFLPGFSTKDNITEFSGRGVGMDVVVKNLETVGGAVSVDSVQNLYTCITLKIPLTLAIVDGMNVRVGNSRYTIPTISIKESFRAKEKDIIRDPEGNEMIMVRGQCYPIIRIHQYYRVKTHVTDFSEGILMMVEQNDKSLCIFVDELLGQQQVVVKALPNYIKTIRNIEGLAGCTLLGDGSISLILDIGGLVDYKGYRNYI